MAFIEWQDRFLTGVEPFDDHHRHLFFLFNKAYEDSESDTLKDSLGALLNELIDYTIYHFHAEETWMEEHHFPKHEKHCQEHARFMTRISELHADYLSGQTQINLEVLAFMKNWIEEHIMISDAEYGRFHKIH